MPDPTPIRDAIAAALADGPILAAARVERALRTACPHLANGWALAHVARLVAAGQLPEHEVAAALAQFRSSDNSTIRNKPAYLAAILKRHLAQHGQPWRKAQ